MATGQFRKARRAPLHLTLLQITVAGVAAVLIIALWAAALLTTDIDRDFALRQARSQAATLALSLEEGVHRQFALIDQSLRILEMDWERDPTAFSFQALRQRAGSMADLLVQVSVIDERGRIIDGTRKDMLGVDRSSRRYFQAHRAQPSDKSLVDGPNRDEAGGEYYLTISRRLDAPDGRFAGVVVSSYDLGMLMQDMAQADLGPQGAAMLVGRDGIVRALYNRAVRTPGADISNTSLFQVAFNAPGGTWTGDTPVDSVERIHAFRAVPDRDMVLIVGLDLQAVLANSMATYRKAIMAAAAISVLLVLIAIGLNLNIGITHRRELRLAHDRAVLAAANQQLNAAREQADAKSAELETTLASMSDGVSLFDRDLRLVNWNQRFGELAGVPPGLLQVGMPIEAILRVQAQGGEFGANQVEAEVANRMAQVRARASMGVSERYKPDGRIIELRRTALPDGGFVTLYTDITARKRAEAAQRRAREAAEQAADEKSRFLAIVSHEIRTPLNVSVNAFRLLDHSELAPTQRKLVQNGLHAGEALMSLMNDILDLSRMEVGRLALKPAPFPLLPVLDGIVEMFRTPAAERGVDFALEILPGVPELIRTDIGRLRQILINLVSNAGKFADAGAAELRASVLSTADGPRLRIAVRDSGPPIPDLERSRLFRAFTQLERQHFGSIGAGLGLAVSQLLANLLDGEIGCDPVANGGKEFWLSLRLDQIAVTGDEQPVGGEVANLRLPHSRVLVVEDVVANQLIAATLLRREGHAVDLASSGEEALCMVASRPYDLVLMDILMPGMDGVETADRIRAMPGHLSRLPIVALTANVSAANRLEYLRSGFQDVLEKPVDRSALLATLASFVWGRRGIAANVPAHAKGKPPPVSIAADRAVVQPPLLDEPRLQELRGGLPAAIFADMLESGIDDLRQRVPALWIAADCGDLDGLRKIAHAMAGVAGSFGLPALEALLRQVMGEAEAQDGAAATRIEAVKQLLDRSEAALRQQLVPEAA